ncbi:pkd2, partial [Symbiodinium sp. CCMP2456]
MAFFMTIFLVFVLQVSRVQDSYSLAQIHRSELMGREWYEYHPTRVMDFRNISLTPKSYEQWMRKAVYEGEMRCVGKLEVDADNCIPDLRSDGDPFVREEWQLFTRSLSSEAALKLSARPETADLNTFFDQSPPAAAEGMTMGFIPKGTVPVETAVRFRTWNVGVMPNNHARIILQIPCYTAVTNERFKEDYPFQLNSVFRSCSTTDCMGKLLQEQQVCYSFDGEEHPAASVTGASTGVSYVYTTQEGANGVVLGLGGTPAEAETVMDLLLQDAIHPISMTLQFVTYNGNMDMFTHSRVSFELEPTGVLSKNVHTVVFPLNVFTMGLTDFAEQRQNTNHALFITYVVAAVLFLILVLRDVLIQLQLTSLQKPWYMFILDFFLDDVWNFLDVIVLVVNGLVIDSIFRYMMIDGTFDLRNGFQSWTDNFVFLGTASLETQDAYEAFGKAARLYDTFITLSSLNGLVLLLRFAKYFRSVSSLRLVLTTLTAALQELFMISALIIVVLVAVVLLMHNRFGVIFHRYGTLESSSQSVFFFLTGSFDTADLYGAFPIFFLLVTILFQISFLLILNLLIAAIIYRWKDSRRDAEDFSVLSFWTTLRDNVNVFKGNKAGGRSHDERNLHKLDPSFWRNLAVLRHIDKLDESGKINFNADRRSESPKARREEEENRERDDEEASYDEEAGILDFSNPQDQHRFITVFKKAHMEIASQMTKDVVTPDEEAEKSHAAGVGSLEDKPELMDLQAHVEKRWEQEMEAEALGIVEDPQAPSTVQTIQDNLNRELEKSSHPAEEIWLDALLTVLEDANALEKLQKLFLPRPMIEPKKAHEWSAFIRKKLILERRLNHFLRWLQEEARVKHYEYVREMAVSKERVLKQQSLVLTDYLQTLDVQQLGLKRWAAEPSSIRVGRVQCFVLISTSVSSSRCIDPGDKILQVVHELTRRKIGDRAPALQWPALSVLWQYPVDLICSDEYKTQGLGIGVEELFLFFMVVIIVYIFSIAFTQLAQGTVMGSVYFPTVQHAMYSLLIYGTFLDDIAPFCDAVGAESIACLTLVFIFSILSACTVLNLLIGVLCEVVSQVAQNEKEDIMVQFVTMKLQTLLQSLDINNDGRISQAEFVQIMELPEAVLALEEVGIDAVSIVDFTEYIFGGE